MTREKEDEEWFGGKWIIPHLLPNTPLGYIGYLALICGLATAIPLLIYYLLEG